MDTFTTATAPFDNGPFDAGTESHGQRHHNQPPLEERVLLEFEEALKTPRESGYTIAGRIAEILESALRVPDKVEDQQTCGKVGDLLKIAKAAQQAVEDTREELNRPLLNAQRSLKARQDATLQPLLDVGGKLRNRVNAFVAAEEAKRQEAQRLAAEAARAATEAAQAVAPSAELVPQVQAAPIAKVQVRGDYGSSVSARKVWKHEIEVPIKQLPKALLENQKVVDAVNQVIGALVRGGTREIKGVRIFETTEATVR